MPVNLSEVVPLSIEKINHQCYLGSNNHEGGDPTGGLSGYFIAVSRRVFQSMFAQPRYSKYELLLAAASVSHVGVGNCGELSAALCADLFASHDLSSSQKEMIKVRGYPTKDAHLFNSYVQVEKTIYDIWGGESYPLKRLEAKTGVKLKKHVDRFPVDTSQSPSEFSKMFHIVRLVFAREFDARLVGERKHNFMYVTFDPTDKSDFAILGHQAFPYLTQKFRETFEAPYFKHNGEEAKIIREKIINNFIYLLEELRQDLPVLPTVANCFPVKKKHTDEEAAKEINALLQNEAFTQFIMAISYRNVNPSRALTQLLELKARLVETSDSFLINVMSVIDKEITTLENHSAVSASSSVSVVPFSVFPSLPQTSTTVEETSQFTPAT